MSFRNSIKAFIIFTALIPFLAISTAGCAKIRGLVQDDSYLTPIPQTTLDAYQYGQPVETRSQAVIVAQMGGLPFHTNFIDRPVVIFAEKMDYGEALRRIERSRPTTYFDPTPLDTPVWLVVFKAEYTLTEPLGTISPPYSGCALALVQAEDGGPMRFGTGPCENLDLAR
jgi:hypothetical protein